MLLTLPISLLRLPGGTSLLALFTNLVAVPISSAAMVFGGLSALVRPFPLLQKPLVTLTEPLLEGMLWFVRRLRTVRVPGLLGKDAAVLLPLALALLLVAAALLWRYFGKRLRQPVLLLAVLVLLICWLPALPRQNDILLQRLDTGEGISVLLSRRGETVLLACGGDSLPAVRAEQAISAVGAQDIGLFLLPSGSDALASGATQLLREVPVRRVIAAEANAQAQLFAEICHQAAAGLSALPLWEGCAGWFLNDPDALSCYLRLNGYTVLLIFSTSCDYAQLPPIWLQAGTVIVAGQPPDPLALRVTQRGKVRLRSTIEIV
jgi:hypothetical protein